MTWPLAICLGFALGVSLVVTAILADLCGDLEELARSAAPEPIRKRSALSEVR